MPLIVHYQVIIRSCIRGHAGRPIRVNLAVEEAGQLHLLRATSRLARAAKAHETVR